MRRLIAALLGTALLTACGSETASAPIGANPPATPSPAARAYSDVVLADHPAAYWRMNESSGTTMVDSSPNHNDGAYEGTAGLGQPGARKSTAVLFDGKGDALVPTSPSLAVTAATIEFWMKKRSDAGFGVYVVRNSDCSGNRACFHVLNHGSLSQLEFRVVADPGAALISSQGVKPGSWSYIVATYDGATARLYVNGTLDSSRPVAATPVTSADTWYIGRRADGFFADAIMQDVALYPVALSADQVAAHWRAASN